MLNDIAVLCLWIRRLRIRLKLAYALRPSLGSYRSRKHESTVPNALPRSRVTLVFLLAGQFVVDGKRKSGMYVAFETTYEKTFASTSTNWQGQQRGNSIYEHLGTIFRCWMHWHYHSSAFSARKCDFRAPTNDRPIYSKTLFHSRPAAE